MEPSQFIPFGQVDDAYDKLHADLEFAYKRAKVLADILNIPIHESAEVTGTILGLVRGKVERLSKLADEYEKLEALYNTLLCFALRDGGQHLQERGRAKAHQDAIVNICKWRGAWDELTLRGINK